MHEYPDGESHDPSVESPGNPDYTPNELRRNRLGIFAGTCAFIVGCWTYVLNGAMPFGGGVALTIIGLVVATILAWLFASGSSSKLDENSAGSGKRVKPRTMGTILGYFYDGFKH